MHSDLVKAIAKKEHCTSEKKKYPRMRPHTTVRYDMAVAGEASTNRKAAVNVTCAPYAHAPAKHHSFIHSLFFP